jgi:hypothetical protein
MTKTKNKRRPSSMQFRGTAQNTSSSMTNQDNAEKKLKNVRKKAKLLPWEMPEVNKRVIKAFNLRLPEPEFLKLKYVIEKTKAKSLHSFCVEVVKKEVEKQLKKIAG